MILGPNGKPYSAQRRRQRPSRIHAEYDAAKTSSENENHWANADFRSPDASSSVAVRKTIRSRARYECQENNSFGKGIILTLANDTIGRGPRLQMRTQNREVNTFFEREFGKWLREIHAPEKLRTMRVSKVVDGESFSIPVTNMRLRTPVKLDLRLIETDQVTSPAILSMDRDVVDGVRYDTDGNPIEYTVMKQHPGSMLFFLNPTDFETVSQDKMIHLFREDRPGQRRGVSEIATALPLFAQLRRYVLAVLASAEVAADYAAVMYTDSPNIDPVEIENDSLLPIDRRYFQVLPEGWKVEQLKAEQPTAQFKEFRNAIINEMARCVNMPFNVAAGDSSDYNYASGRLDHQTYHRSIIIEQDYISRLVLDRIFDWWFDEAVFIPDYLPNINGLDITDREWFWDGFEHVDPQKESNAQKTRIEIGTSNVPLEQAKAGIDHVKALAKEAEYYGITPEELQKRRLERDFGAIDSNNNESQRKQVQAIAADWMEENADEIVSELMTV